MHNFELHNPLSLITLRCILHYVQDNSPQSYLGISYTSHLQTFQLSIFQQHLSQQFKHHIQNIKYLSQYLKQIYLTKQYELLQINYDEIIIKFKYKNQWKGKQTIIKQIFKSQRKGYVNKGKENIGGSMESRIKKEIKNYIESEDNKIKLELNSLKDQVAQLKYICDKLNKKIKSNKKNQQNYQSEDSQSQKNGKKSKKIRKPYQRRKKQHKDNNNNKEKQQFQQIQIKKNQSITSSHILNNQHLSPLPNKQHAHTTDNTNQIKVLKQQACNKIKLQQSFQQKPSAQLSHSHLLSNQQQRIMLLRASCINQHQYDQKQLKIQLQQSNNLIDTLQQQQHMNTYDNVSLINSESEEYQQEQNSNQYNNNNQQQQIEEQEKQQFTGPLVVTSRQATRYYYSKGYGKPKSLFRNMEKKLLDKKYKEKIMTMSLEQWCQAYPYINNQQNNQIKRIPHHYNLSSSLKLTPTFQDHTFYKKQPLKGFIKKDNKFMKLSSQATKMYRYFYLSLISRQPFNSKIGKQYWVIRVLGSVDLEIVIGVYNGDEKIKNDTFPRSMVGVHLGHGYVKDQLGNNNNNNNSSNNNNNNSNNNNNNNNTNISNTTQENLPKKPTPSTSGPAWRHIIPQSKQDQSLYLKIKQQLYQLIQKGQCYIFIHLDMDNNTIEFYLNNSLLVRSKLSKNCIKNKEKIHALISMYNEKDCVEVV